MPAHSNCAGFLFILFVKTRDQELRLWMSHLFYSEFALYLCSYVSGEGG